VHAATDPAVTPVRDLITNVTVLHRQLDTPIPPVPILHGQAKHGDVLFGVKKFIHFEFSLQPGFCVARQFSVRDSPAYIMSLSTENPTICQACSDFKVRVRAVVCVLPCACCRVRLHVAVRVGIDYVQADVVLTADCTCHSRPAVQAKKRPRRQKQAVAAASDADDASDDNEGADDAVEEEEDGDASAWIQPKDLDKLEMVAVWNRMRGEATSDCFLAGITGHYPDGTPVAVWFNAGKTSTKPLGDRVFQPSWYDQKDEKETFSYSSPGEQFELSTAKYNATDALLMQKFKLTAQHKIPPNLIGELTDALAKKVTRHKKAKKQ